MSVSFTVIIPVYNCEKYLRRCLDSVLDQSYQDFDVICIDDKSPDNSKEILKEYTDKMPGKIRALYNEENIGQGQSRMKGVLLSEADYIVFVDSDDYISNDYLQSFVSVLETEQYDTVFEGYTKDINGKLKKKDIYDSMWTLVCYPLACCKAFRREFLIKNQIDFSAERTGEDIYFAMSVFYHAESFKIIHEYGYHYVMNPTSTTMTITADKKLEKSVADMYDRFLIKHDISSLTEERRQMLEYAYASNMVNALVVYAKGCGKEKMRQKYDFFFSDFERKFPDYRSNPYFSPFKAKKVSLKIRTGVDVTITLHKMGLAWPLYRLLSAL